MSTDKRKQSLYFPETMLKDLQHEADRLDRSLSWVVQRCVRIGMLELKKIAKELGKKFATGSSVTKTCHWPRARSSIFQRARTLSEPRPLA